MLPRPLKIVLVVYAAAVAVHLYVASEVARKQNMPFDVEFSDFTTGPLFGDTAELFAGDGKTDPYPYVLTPLATLLALFLAWRYLPG